MEDEAFLDWIESAGGPLLMLEEDLLSHWRGSQQVFIGEPTDYERACAVDDYIALIAVNSREGIVLGEEPFRTAWWFSLELGYGFLVRWVFANSEADVLQALKNLPSDKWERTGLKFDEN